MAASSGAAYTLLLGWPVVPTLLALSTARRRIWWLSWAAYVAAVTTLLALAGESTIEVLTIAIPMLFVLATSTRALRGAAWLVAPGLMLLGLTVAVWWPILIYLRYGAPFDRFAWTLLATAIGLPVVLVAYSWTIVRVYQSKWASDQTLLILQWWFVTALWWTLLLGTQGEHAALLGLAPTRCWCSSSSSSHCCDAARSAAPYGSCSFGHSAPEKGVPDCCTTSRDSGVGSGAWS